jgi:Rrf2 family protein
MMSNKCFYAVRAMVELTKHEGAGPLTIGAIAAAQRIPVRFLEAILRQLKQAGLTDSHRGKDGGYVLARHARDIAVGEVIRLFEGARAQTSAAANAEDDSSDAWVIARLHEKAEAALAEVYDANTFADLAQQVRDREAKFVIDFSI